MASILTLDLGTSYFKCCRWDTRGELLHLERVPTPVKHPQPGHAEIDTEGFKRCIVALVGAVGGTTGGLDDVAAVSFATQTNSFVLLDEQNVALTPIILWSDQRGHDCVASLHDIVAEPGFHHHTGVPQLSAEFAIAKLRWLQLQRPEVMSRVSRFCLLSDYLTLWLTGRHMTEAGAAGLTGLLDIHTLRWLKQHAELVGLSLESLPEVARAGTDLASLSPAAANALNLPVSCRCVVGCLDQYAGAIGVGNVHADCISETTGTVLATVRATHTVSAKQQPEVFFGPACVPGLFYAMCFGNISANLLAWYQTQLPEPLEFAALARLASEVAPGADSLRVKREPRLERAASVFIGMREIHSRGHFVRSIMERVALALREQLMQLGSESAGTIRACGGAARSPEWLQIKADLIGQPVQTTTCPEPTSLGAAILAGRALGWGDLSSLTEEWVRLGPVHRPSPARHAAYARIIKTWFRQEG